MRHNDVKRLLYEFVRGELDAEQAEVVDKHIARCNKCFGELQIIKETIRIVATSANKPSEERSEAFWARFQEKVEERTRAEKPQPVVSNPIWDEIWSVVTYRRPVVLTAAGVAFLAIVAVIMWTYGPMSQQVDQQSVQVVGGVKADSLRVELADYFRRSKILLVGISNISMEQGEHLDLSTERQAARRLFQQARYLDDRAPDERSHQLIKALERILLELANMEKQADLPDVEIVRSGIHQENMLFKIRMAESEFALPDNDRK
jgi:hypothetical protein